MTMNGKLRQMEIKEEHSMKKTAWRNRVIGAVLCFAMVCPCAGTAAAQAPAGAAYTSDSGYTAQKITHPGSGTGTADGIVDYTGNGTLDVNLPDGTGDRGQNYTWGSIGYGDYMYIGTCYGAWMNTLNTTRRS